MLKKTLKLNRLKSHFRCMSIPVLKEIVSRNGIMPNSYKLQVSTEMPASKIKKTFNHFYVF